MHTAKVGDKVSFVCDEAGHKGEVLLATVTAVNADGTANLSVENHGGSGSFDKTSVKGSENKEPGTYHCADVA